MFQLFSTQKQEYIFRYEGYYISWFKMSKLLRYII